VLTLIDGEASTTDLARWRESLDIETIEPLDDSLLQLESVARSLRHSPTQARVEFNDATTRLQWLAALKSSALTPRKISRPTLFAC
jgi:hypothetical protein